MDRQLTCPYCHRPARLTDGAEIYPHRPDLAHLNFWACTPCAAWVGCHAPNEARGLEGDEPLGRLADETLRQAKSAAHRAFDPLWRRGPFGSRKSAYCWLAAQLRLPVEECHIGMFDERQCRRVVEVCHRQHGTAMEDFS